MIEEGNTFQGKEVWYPDIINCMLGCNAKNRKVYPIGEKGSIEEEIWVYENTDTGNTVIAGNDGGNGWCRILVEAGTSKEALKIYEEKKAAKKIFTEAWEKHEAELKIINEELENAKIPINEAELRSRFGRELKWYFRWAQPNVDKKTLVEICKQIIKEFEATPV